MNAKIFCQNNEENHVKEFFKKHPGLSPLAVIVVRPIGTTSIQIAIPGDRFNPNNGVREQATTSIGEVKKSVLAERTNDGKWLIAFRDQSALFDDKIVLLINDLYYQTYNIISGKVKNSALRDIGSGLLSIGYTKIRDSVSIREIADISS